MHKRKRATRRVHATASMSTAAARGDSGAAPGARGSAAAGANGSGAAAPKAYATSAGATGSGGAGTATAGKPGGGGGASTTTAAIRWPQCAQPWARTRGGPPGRRMPPARCVSAPVACCCPIGVKDAVRGALRDLSPLISAKCANRAAVALAWATPKAAQSSMAKSSG